MRKKRAKALRKLAGFRVHKPREYFAIPTGAKRTETKIDAKGVKTTEEKDLFQFVAGQERR
jgi:hypothetical protein